MKANCLEKLDYEALSIIFNSLSTKERVMSLELFENGKMQILEISKASGMSRSGFQNIIEAFRQAGLIEQAGHRSFYKLSVKGQKVMEFVRNLNNRLLPIEEQVKKRQLKASIAKFGAGLSEEEIADIFRELKEEEKEE